MLQKTIPDIKGTYILILYISQAIDLLIGKLGTFHFKSGYYTYVGSAFGPGGLKARIRHHLKFAERPHWHMDYLRPKAQIIEIRYEEGKMEHIWAELLSQLAGARIPVKGFGCSDCRCPSHLYYYPSKPSLWGIKL